MSQQISDLSRVLEGTDFQRELLNEFVTRGLGSLPGRETTVVLVSLMLKHHPVWKKQPPKDYELARLLKTSPRKIRNIRDELSYRDEGRTDDQLRKELAELLKKEAKAQSDEGLKIQIDDGLLRDFVCDQLRRTFSLVEYGNNPRILSVRSESMVALGLTVLNDVEVEKLVSQIGATDDADEGKAAPSTLRRLFFESFVSAAGTELGKKAPALVAAVASGGLSEVIKLAREIRLPQQQEVEL